MFSAKLSHINNCPPPPAVQIICRNHAPTHDPIHGSLPTRYHLKITTMNQRTKILIPALALFPMCLNAITYTADPGAGAIDISAAPVTNGGATFDSTGGVFNSNAQFFGNGDLTILAGGKEVDLVGNSSFVGNVYANSAIDIYNSGSLGADSNTLYLNSAMNVRSTTTHAQAIRIGANVRIQPASTGNTTTLSGNITFDGDYRLQLGNGFSVADRNVTITGDITDGAFTNGRIDIDGDNSLFVFSGNNNYDGITNVKDPGARLNIDGTHTGGNLLVGAGAFLGGSGTILFQDGMTITNAGTLDLASLLFDVSALTDTWSSITLADYTGGSLSNTPANLQDVLTNSSGWTLIDTGTLLQVTAIPEPSTFSMLAGALALGVVFTRRRMQ
jgi:hypothetical protein